MQELQRSLNFNTGDEIESGTFVRLPEILP
jgi:hypothetical protein